MVFVDFMRKLGWYNRNMNDLGLSSRAWFLWNNSARREVIEARSGSGGEISGAEASEEVSGESGSREGRFSHEADTPMEVASLTKIMTAMVVLEQRNLDEEVTITAEMLEGLEEFSVIGLREGQVATVEDLLYALMLPSAGDAAQALAISTSGTIEEFAKLMNREAENLGMTGTHFSNPVGFDWREGAGDKAEVSDGAEVLEEVEIRNYSTARDVAKMLRAALQNERFREIFGTYERELTSVGLVARKTFLAPGTGAVYGGIKGGKTGFTFAAGRCFASVAEVEGTEYILVTLGAPAEGTEFLADAEKVYRAVEAEYEPVRLVEKGDLVARVPVEGSPVKALEFRAGVDYTVALPKDFQAEDLSYVFDGQAVVRRGTVVGEPFGKVAVSYNGEVLFSLGLTVQESCEGVANCVEMPKFYNYYGWLGLGLLITALLAMGTVWAFIRKRRSGRKVWRILPWVGVLMTILNIVLIWMIFEVWYKVTDEVEVFRPEVSLTEEPEEAPEEKPEEVPAVDDGGGTLSGGNCTTGLGSLMLVNPNFTVGAEFITGRRTQLISVSQTYGIPEYHEAGNGDNLMMPEAAEHLNEMVTAYRAENPGHEMGTYSCFRARGTTCGRLCAATGTSDHHTGLTCDLIDLAYGSVLNTDDYLNHLEWQWLRENSYRFGFIDRFPEAWAGGPMTEPANVDAEGSTGLFETWHYRYVGVTAATEIATGKYNGGEYDSLEHYLRATGRVKDLKGGKCE